MTIPTNLPIMQAAAALREIASREARLSALAPPEREAAAFARVLESLPVAVHPEELLAGDWRWQFASAEVRETVSAFLSTPPTPAGETDVLQLLDEGFHCRAGWSPAHTCADYQMVVERGLGWLGERVAEALAERVSSTPVILRSAVCDEGPCRDGFEARSFVADGAPQDDKGVAGFGGSGPRAEREQAEPEQATTLRAMQVALRGVIAFAHRLADMAEAQGLAEVAAICRRVPEHPAQTLREALQAIWIVHFAVGVSEYCDASLSLGRLDQYLYPLFLRDRQRGVSVEEQRGLLVEFWHKLNRFGDPACAVNLGGLDGAGNDLWNPLTDLIVEVTREVRLPSPILAARVHGGLADETFDALLAPELLRIGQPTFYGEDACRETMTRRGVPEAQAHGFAVNSCMGLVMPGEEIADMWGVVSNLLLPLELTLNHGRPFAHDLPLALQTPPRLGYASFDELYAQWEAYLGELVAYLVARQAEATQWVGRERPNPFFSALTADCLQRGLDRAIGGVRYHGITVEGFGWANATDALTAIQRLVFGEGKYTLAELTAAAQADFVGHEALLADLRECPKYGNADAEADAMAARVTDTFAALVTAHNHDNLYYLPSYHTLNVHVYAGAKLPASLDGRRAGQPLGKNAGPLPENRRGPLTALLLSASAIDQRALAGGQALDISVDPKLLVRAEDRRKLQALLLTYFARGGLQIQVNGLGAEELREAIAEPQAHRDLIVRIAGFSARFVDLGLPVQEEMVERFAVGL